MEKEASSWTLGQIADWVGGVLCGPADLQISRPISAEDDEQNGITFAQNDTFLTTAEAGKAAAILLPRDKTSLKPHIQVDDPKFAFMILLTKAAIPQHIDSGIHPTAVIHPSSTIHPTAKIGPRVSVGPDCQIAAGAELHPGVVIGANCSVGERTILHPNVTFYDACSIGSESVVHSGVVVGADGFGFVFDGQKQIKVPQIGRVEIGSYVEIGPNTTIDRATTGVTKIGDGVKLDNQIQIGHNVSIGDHTVIAGLTGIAGSVKIGKRNIIGGATKFRDHVTTVDDVIIGGASGVDSDIKEPGTYFGQPVQPMSVAKRVFLLIPKLPELFSRLREVERKLKDIDPKS